MDARDSNDLIGAMPSESHNLIGAMSSETRNRDSVRRESARPHREEVRRESRPSPSIQLSEIQADIVKSIHWKEIRNGGGAGDGKKALALLHQQQSALADARKGIMAPGIELHINMYKKKIKDISDLVTRYNLSDDSPAYINNTFSKPVRELMTQLNTTRLSISTPMIDVVRAVRNRSCVIVIGWRNSDGVEIPDQVWSKEAILDAAMKAKDLSKPISRIAKEVEFMPTVNKDETADQVLQTMTLTGNAQIGITNEDGTVIGIVEMDGIHLAFLQSLEDEFPEQMDSLLVSRQISTEMGSLGDSYKEDLTVKERKTLKEQAAVNHQVGRVQKMAQDWCEAAWTEMLILLLLLLDVTCSIYELTIPAREVETGIDNPLMVVTGCILFVYSYEASLRVFGYRWSLLNGTRLLETADVAVVLSSIIVYIITLASAKSDRPDVYITVARVIRFLRLIKIIKRVRRMLLANRSRYQKDGFDLSLTYVTPSCIAMCFPASGADATFLNPIDDVIRFFMTKHPKHYLLFNLCAERSYDHALFDGMVEHIEIDDRNPPTIDQTASFLERANFFMSEDPSNVIAIHCKTGKGRTCVLVCAWLMYCQYCESSQEAIEYFVKQRMGVSAARQGDHEFLCASQKRYLSYTQQMIADGGFRTNGLFLKTITLHTCPKVGHGHVCCPWFTIEENGRLVFDWSSRNRMEEMRNTDGVREFPNINLLLTGDIRVVMYHHENHREELLCYIWAHTGFIEQEHLTFKKEVIDMACSDRDCETFDEQFKIELQFESIPKKMQQGEGLRGAGSGRGLTRQNSSGHSLGSPHALASDSVGGSHHSDGIFGAWRRLEEVNHLLQRKAAKNRGRQASVTETSTVLVADNPQQRLSLVPIEDNLCCAVGPAVRHDSVQIVALKSLGEVHGHKLRKRLFKYYRGGIEKARGDNLLVRTAKHTVSGHKKRFQEGDFDLDLTYITPRLIAMGYPSRGVEGRFRNSEDEVYRFFQERHAGHYRIINLVQEREYDLDVFHGQVARYPFPDHFPPAMELLLPCCAHIHRFLQADDNNVVAVHCKAGKGRTGLIMVCYLLYGGLLRSALEARKFYDSQRTSNKKGLTIISQIRYAHYFEEQLRRIKRNIPCPVAQSVSQPLRLFRLRMHSIPHFDRDGGCDPFVVISCVSEAELAEKEVFSSFSPSTTTKHVVPSMATWDTELGVMDQGLVVAGDIHVALYDYEVFSKPRRMCHLWMHSNFMMKTPIEMGGREYELSHRECIQEGLPEGTWRIIFDKHEIDSAAQDERGRMFDADFKVEILFAPTDASIDMPDSPRSEATSVAGAGLSQRSMGGERRSITLTRALSSRLNKAQSQRDKKDRKFKRSLYQEKHEYYQYLEELEMRGLEGASFNDWLLTRDASAGPVPLVDLKGQQTGPLERPNSTGSSATISSEGQGTSFKLNVKQRLPGPDLREEAEHAEESDAAAAAAAADDDDDDDARTAGAASAGGGGRGRGGGGEAGAHEEGEEAGRGEERGSDDEGHRTVASPSPPPARSPPAAAGAATRSPGGGEGGEGAAVVSPSLWSEASSMIVGPLAGGPPTPESDKGRARELLLPPPSPSPTAGGRAALRELPRAGSAAEAARARVGMDEVAGMASLGADQWPISDPEPPPGVDRAPLPGSPTHVELLPPPCVPPMSGMPGILEAEHAAAQEGGFYDPPSKLAPAQAPAALSEATSFYDPPPPKK